MSPIRTRISLPKTRSEANKIAVQIAKGINNMTTVRRKTEMRAASIVGMVDEQEPEQKYAFERSLTISFQSPSGLRILNRNKTKLFLVILYSTTSSLRSLLSGCPGPQGNTSAVSKKLQSVKFVSTKKTFQFPALCRYH